LGRVAAFLLVAAVAAATFWHRSSIDAERETVALWRERAYEAEQRIAALRGELARTRRAELARDSRGASSSGGRCVAQPPSESLPLLDEEGAVRPSATVQVEDATRLDPAWDALVSDALHGQVLERLGGELEPEREARLLDRLREVREVAGDLESDEETDAGNALRQRFERSVVLLEADRAFRDELGIGIAEFLAGFEDGAIEDVAALRGPTAQVPE
jgi:hypothetical protein